MAVTELGVPIYIITGLVLLSQISLFSQVYAAPHSDLNLQQLNFHDNLSKDGITFQPENSLESRVSRKIDGEIVDQETNSLKPTKISGKQIVGSVFGASVDKVTSMITVTSNFLNARTQIKDVDRFLSTFSDFFASDGITAINTYYTVFSNAWVVIDAVAMFVRFIEAREKGRKADAKDALELEETAALADEVVDILGVTNQRLDDFKRSMQILICRRAANVKRSGSDRFQRAAEERQLDCSSLLKRIDENKKRRDDNFRRKILEPKLEDQEENNEEEEKTEENDPESIDEAERNGVRQNVIRKRVLSVGMTSQPYASVARSNTDNNVIDV